MQKKSYFVLKIVYTEALSKVCHAELVEACKQCKLNILRQAQDDIYYVSETFEKALTIKLTKNFAFIKVNHEIKLNICMTIYFCYN
jgi:hypothetical protein